MVVGAAVEIVEAAIAVAVTGLAEQPGWVDFDG